MSILATFSTSSTCGKQSSIETVGCSFYSSNLFISIRAPTSGLLIPLLSRHQFELEFSLKFGPDNNCRQLPENGMDNLARILTNMFLFFHSFNENILLAVIFNLTKLAHSISYLTGISNYLYIASKSSSDTTRWSRLLEC